LTHIPQIEGDHFDGGGNVTSFSGSPKGLAKLLRLIINHLNAAIAFGYVTLDSYFTSDGSGNWQVITGLETTVEMEFGGSIHAIATIQAETASGVPHTSEYAVEINGSQGDSIARYLIGTNDVGAIAAQHLVIVEEGTYTVKAKIKDVSGTSTKAKGQLIARGIP
jgi:hypothetical protein